MDIGYRIKYIRKLKGLTQKELGLRLGFPENAADVRIAQYESGARVPKEDVVNDFAKALDVSPKALIVPTIKSIDDVIQMVFAFEDVCRFESLFEEDEIVKFVNLWREKRHDFLEGRISKEEYEHWRFNYTMFSEE